MFVHNCAASKAKDLKRRQVAIIVLVMNKDKYVAGVDRREISALNSIVIHT